MDRIRSFGQIKQLKDATATEDALQDEILKWFLDTYRADVIDQSVDNDQPEEALYFSRYEVMEKLLLHQYPSLSESFTDHMIELLYAELFLKSGHFSKTALLSCSDLWYNRTIKYTIER